MDISYWRRRIDTIDTQLVALLNERAKCALHIGRFKRKANLQVYDPEREHLVLKHAISASRGPLTDDAIRRLFERIIDESRRLERLYAEQDDPDLDGDVSEEATSRTE